MNRPTHVAGALALGVGISAAAGLNPAQAAVFTGAGALAAGAPDGDRVLDDSRNHRSMTHSVATVAGLAALALVYLRPATERLAALMSDAWTSRLSSVAEAPLIGPAVVGQAPLVGAWLAGLGWLAVLGALVGYASHLALDAMTPAGVWLFLPGGPRLRFVVVDKVGNHTELALRAALRALFWLGVVAVPVAWVAKLLGHGTLFGFLAGLWPGFTGLGVVFGGVSS